MIAGTFFVTGATGFIGSNLVIALLQRGCRVFALTRSSSGQVAEERLESALEMTYGKPLPTGIKSHLEVVEGDLVLPRLGMDSDLRERIAAETGQIFHCGGDIRFEPKDMKSFRAVHLEGPMNVLDALCAGRRPRFHHVSTAYVAGRREGIAYEDELDVGQTFRNPYERIKLKSEQNIRRACADMGVDLSVFRPSIVIADPDSPASMWRDPITIHLAAFARLCRFFGNRIQERRSVVRIRGAEDSRLNFVPVTYIIEAMLQAAATEEHHSSTYHLVDPDPPKNLDLVNQLIAILGISGLKPIGQERHPIEGMNSLERKVDKLLSPYRDYLFESPVFDDRNARSLLNERSGSNSGAALRLFARAAALVPDQVLPVGLSRSK